MLNEHFAAGFQKVGTFQIVNGQKQGGNVATYFCTADGRVLHAIAGPVDARTLLTEAKWAIDLNEKARNTGNRRDNDDFKKFVRQAHADWLKKQADDPPMSKEVATGRRVLTTQSHICTAIHTLLAAQGLDDIEEVYKKVWEGILKEKVSNDPVSIKGFLR